MKTMIDLNQIKIKRIGLLKTSISHRQTLLAALQSYQPFDRQEAADQQRTIEFLNQETDCFSRDNQNGHITASSWIVHQQSSMILLTHHRKLNRWFQLGGHMEAGEDPLTSALREASEESGIHELEAINDQLFDIDVHLIPARGNQDAHFHYDLRYLLSAKHTETKLSDESHQLKWFAIEQLSFLDQDHSLQRMAKKHQLKYFSHLAGESE